MPQSPDDCNRVLGKMPAEPIVITGQVPIKGEKRTCANTQCRVEGFTGDRCPACYGAPS